MTLSATLLFYTFLILGISALALLYSAYRNRGFRWELSRSRLCRCQKCDRIFLARRQAQVARCPQCHGISSTNL